MAMIPCPECKKEINDSASTCPHCGKQLTRWVTWTVLTALFVVLIPLVIRGWFGGATNSPPREQVATSSPGRDDARNLRKEQNQPLERTIPIPSCGKEIYPLAVGNEWEYSIRFRPDPAFAGIRYIIKIERMDSEGRFRMADYSNQAVERPFTDASEQRRIWASAKGISVQPWDENLLAMAQVQGLHPKSNETLLVPYMPGPMDWEAEGAFSKVRISMESIAVPAGTFSCLVVEEKEGGTKVPRDRWSLKRVRYFSPGVGLVREDQLTHQNKWLTRELVSFRVAKP